MFSFCYSIFVTSSLGELMFNYTEMQIVDSININREISYE